MRLPRPPNINPMFWFVLNIIFTLWNLYALIFGGGGLLSLLFVGLGIYIFLLQYHDIKTMREYLKIYKRR